MSQLYEKSILQELEGGFAGQDLRPHLSGCVFCKSDLDKLTTVCKVGNPEVSPKTFLDLEHIHVHITTRL